MLKSIKINDGNENFKIKFNLENIKNNLEKDEKKIFESLLKADTNLLKFSKLKILKTLEKIFDIVFIFEDNSYSTYKHKEIIYVLTLFTKEIFEFGINIFSIKKILNRDTLMNISCYLNNNEMFDYHYNEFLKVEDNDYVKYMLGTSDYAIYGPIHYASFHPELFEKIFYKMNIKKINLLNKNQYMVDHPEMTFVHLIDFCVKYKNFDCIKFLSKRSEILFDKCLFCECKGHKYRKRAINYFQNLCNEHHKNPKEIYDTIYYEIILPHTCKKIFSKVNICYTDVKFIF